MAVELARLEAAQTGDPPEATGRVAVQAVGVVTVEGGPPAARQAEEPQRAAMTGIPQAVYSLVGVVIGGGITTVVAVWTQRTQLRNTIAAESRGREIGASASAITALGKLRQRPPDDEVLLGLTTAAQDLRDADLRLRLADVGRILTEHAAANSMAGQEEPVSRKIACDHGIECLGAFRRGEPIPPAPAAFTATLAAIDRWTGATR